MRRLILFIVQLLLAACAQTPSGPVEQIDIGKGDGLRETVTLDTDEIWQKDLSCGLEGGCFLSVTFTYEAAGSEPVGGATLIVEDVFYGIPFVAQPQNAPDMYPGAAYRIDPANNAGPRYSVTFNPTGVLPSGEYLLSVRKSDTVAELGVVVDIITAGACNDGSQCDDAETCYRGTCMPQCASTDDCGDGSDPVSCMSGACVAHPSCSDSFDCDLNQICTNDEGATLACWPL